METNSLIRDITGACRESVKRSVNGRHAFGYPANCSRSDLDQPVLNNAKHDNTARFSKWTECSTDSVRDLRREGIRMRGYEEEPSYELFQDVESISVAKHKRRGE